MKTKIGINSIAIGAVLVSSFWPTTTRAVTKENPAAQHFFCHTGYALDACLAQIEALKNIVAKYPPRVWVNGPGF